MVVGKYAYITTFTSKYTGGNDPRWWWEKYYLINLSEPVYIYNKKYVF